MATPGLIPINVTIVGKGLDKVTTTHIQAVQTENIVDEAIAVAKLADNAVETVKVLDQAITIPISAYTAGSIEFTALTTIQQCSIASMGNPIFITWSCQVQADISVPDTSLPRLRLYRDETQLYEVISNQCQMALNAHNITDTPGAGSYTYYLKAYRPEGAYAYVRSMMLLEVKK